MLQERRSCTRKWCELELTYQQKVKSVYISFPCSMHCLGACYEGSVTGKEVKSMDQMLKKVLEGIFKCCLEDPLHSSQD